MAELETSYGSRPSGSPGFGGGRSTTGQYWPLEKLRKAYSDYLSYKREEIDEQIDARRYYHGSQYTTDQLNTFKQRRQPALTFNRISRKIDGVVGLVERLRQDPKAFPRTPQQEQGAELATAAIRYVIDTQAWKDKAWQSGQDAAVDGIGGIEIELIQGDRGDPDVGLNLVDIQSFFYDPHSYQMDFSDARYLGIGKWLDLDQAKEMFPDASDQAFQSDGSVTNFTDREQRFFQGSGTDKRVRIIECWYRHRGGWCYSIFSGQEILKEGKSYLKDEKGKDLCRYVMFSGNVDQDGDRYGFVRNMKSAQDGINAKQSKMQHMLASKRLILSQGAVDDVEKVRNEWARSDGVVITNRPVNEGVKADDQSFDFMGLSKLLELNMNEIENFGPNPALIGQGVENKSGRAIALLQQAGMAELGPYILGYRGWKLRVYRAVWNAIQRFWQSERWIRVTDNEGLAQFIQLNGLGLDPTGQPTIVNAVGSLDVDVILDEGPDTITMSEDAYQTLEALGPQFAMQFPEIAVKLSPMQASVKKEILDKLEAIKAAGPPPDPAIMREQAKFQMEQQRAAQEAELAKTSADQEFINKQRTAEQDLNVEALQSAQKLQQQREQHQLDMQCQAEKHKMECAHQSQQHAMEVEKENQKTAIEGDRAAQKLKAESEHSAQKIEAEKQLIEIKVTGAKEARKEEKAEPVIEANIKALEKLAESFDRLGTIMSAPKKAVYDKSGRIVASETVLSRH